MGANDKHIKKGAPLSDGASQISDFPIIPQPERTHKDYPPIGTVKGRTLAALLRGERLTHADVWARFGSARAAHHIYVLREGGWDVRTEEIDARTSDGRTARIARYRLAQDDIQEAGERGKRYAMMLGRADPRLLMVLAVWASAALAVVRAAGGA